jgi:hypothetical protein
VDLVDEAHRRQQESGPDAEPRREAVVEVGEFDRHRAASLGAAVLELHLGVEQDAVIELVADVDDGPQRIEPVGPPGGDVTFGLAGEVLVEHLAVATQRNALARLVDLRGRRSEPQDAGVRLHDHVPAEAQLLELAGDRLELGLDPRQVGGVPLLRRGRHGQQRQSSHEVPQPADRPRHSSPPGNG